MSEIKERYIDKGALYNHTDARLPDLRYGGHFGYAPNLSEVVSSTPYIPKDLIIRITRMPGMFDLLEDSSLWKEMLRYLVEVHPKSVTGFDATITLSTSDVPIDPSGAVIKPVNDSTIQHSDITMTYPMDFVGEPIVKFWTEFIRLGIWDPILNRPLISTIVDEVPNDWTLDMYSWDIIAWEPDVHFKKCAKAWEVYGMHVLGSGPIQGSKDPLNPKSVNELSYQCTGVDESNEGTRKIAQKIMDEMSILKANPYNTKSQITDDQLEEVINGKGGYFDTLKSVKDRQLPDA